MPKKTTRTKKTRAKKTRANPRAAMKSKTPRKKTAAKKSARKKATTRKKTTARKKPAGRATGKRAAKSSKAGTAKARAAKRPAPKRTAAPAALTPIDMARIELKHQPDASSDTLARLAPMAGEFRAVVRIWMGPGEPHVATGVMINAFDLDGRFLKQTYHGDTADGPFPNFQGRGFWGYNDAADRWEGFWIDTASNMMQVERGRLDGDAQWTMTGEVINPQTGAPMQKRSVIRVHDRNAHTMETWFAAPDGPEFKAMQIDFTRA